MSRQRSGRLRQERALRKGLGWQFKVKQLAQPCSLHFRFCVV